MADCDLDASESTVSFAFDSEAMIEVDPAVTYDEDSIVCISEGLLDESTVEYAIDPVDADAPSADKSSAPLTDDEIDQWMLCKLMQGWTKNTLMTMLALNNRSVS